MRNPRHPPSSNPCYRRVTARHMIFGCARAPPPPLGGRDLAHRSRLRCRSRGFAGVRGGFVPPHFGDRSGSGRDDALSYAGESAPSGRVTPEVEGPASPCLRIKVVRSLVVGTTGFAATRTPANATRNRHRLTPTTRKRAANLAPRMSDARVGPRPPRAPTIWVSNGDGPRPHARAVPAPGVCSRFCCVCASSPERKRRPAHRGRAPWPLLFMGRSRCCASILPRESGARRIEVCFGVAPVRSAGVVYVLAADGSALAFAEPPHTPCATFMRSAKSRHSVFHGADRAHRFGVAHRLAGRRGRSRHPRGGRIREALPRRAWSSGRNTESVDSSVRDRTPRFSAVSLWATRGQGCELLVDNPANTPQCARTRGDTRHRRGACTFSSRRSQRTFIRTVETPPRSRISVGFPSLPAPQGGRPRPSVGGDAAGIHEAARPTRAVPSAPSRKSRAGDSRRMRVDVGGRLPGGEHPRFFPSNGLGVEAAEQICRSCPVRAECLESALLHRIEQGVWGGASGRERRRILRSRRRAGAISG